MFLTAWKGIYTVFEQGAKTSPQSKQWFGAKATQRRGDTLLQYLYQARNDEEHGLTKSIKLSGGTYLYERGEEKRIQVQPGIMPGTVRAIDPDTGRALKLISQTPPGPTLARVRDRSNKIYGAPIFHLGEHIADTTPIGVAQAALKYTAKMIDEAAALKPAP